ncbi:MAG: helix-turn-helix domain-containing protein [Ruminococcaceae bacterium]|nr:helix-turn-helix domain-containing protein [Oscillospiraceae bacterium]
MFLYRITNNFSMNYYSFFNEKFRAIHTHPLDELVIVESGVSTIMCGDNVCRISGSYVIFYPTGQEHQQNNSKTHRYTRWWITYDRSALDDLLPLEIIPRSFFVLPLREEDLARIQPYLALMINGEHSDEHYAVCRHLLAILFRLLSPMIREQLSEADFEQYKYSRLLHAICRHIDEHFAEPLTLDSIAHQFFISRSKLVRMFRQTLDMSVNDYLTSVRISKSKRFLRDGLSVNEAAIRSGYSHTGYYIKLFRHYIGMTPAEWQEQL